MVKKLFSFIFILIILLIVGGVVGIIYIDSIAKTAIEQGGSYALGVDTTVKKADVGVTTGEFTMKGLDVSNPKGFDSPHFLTLKNADVEVKLTTLMSDIVTLEQLRFAGLDVNLQKRQNKTNYGIILDNLKRFESEDEKPRKKEVDDGKRFIVEKLLIKNIEAHVDLVPEGGEHTKVDLPIERILLKNVGRDTGGVTLGELSKLVVQAVIAAIVERGRDILPAVLLGELRSQLSGLTDLSAYGVEVESALPANIKEVLKKQGIEIPNLDDILGGSGGLGGILGGDDDDGE